MVFFSNSADHSIVLLMLSMRTTHIQLWVSICCVSRWHGVCPLAHHSTVWVKEVGVGGGSQPVIKMAHASSASSFTTSPCLILCVCVLSEQIRRRVINGIHTLNIANVGFNFLHIIFLKQENHSLRGNTKTVTDFTCIVTSYLLVQI